MNGTGKSTVIAARAIEDLRAHRLFLLLDCHGQLADRVIAHADQTGRQLLVVDPLDPTTGRVKLLAGLDRDMANLAEVQRSAARVADAVARRFPDLEWTGPRWHNIARSVLMGAAAAGLDVATAVARAHEPAGLDHRRLPKADPANLRNLHGNSPNGAEVRDWALSKFAGFLPETARAVLAPAGDGADLAAALAQGTPVVVNLAAFPLTDAAMIGHCIVASVLDAALDGRLRDWPVAAASSVCRSCWPPSRSLNSRRCPTQPLPRR